MDIIRYHPWSLLNRLERDAGRLFSARLPEEAASDRAQLADWVPAVDIQEEDERFVIRADLPGVAAKDLDITMEKGVLGIEGRRETRRESEHDGYRRVERVSGRFHRRFSLPDTADSEVISADYKDGVLTISIQKRPQSRARRIAVNPN